MVWFFLIDKKIFLIYLFLLKIFLNIYVYIYINKLFKIKQKKWITHRRIANPALNKALSPEVIGKETIDLINLLDKLVDQPIDINKLMQRITIQILGKIAFSYDFK